MKKVLVIHGPNLQLLGKRNPSIYGKMTLRQINEQLRAEARRLKLQLEIAQFNDEGRIVDAVGAAPGRFHGILINPAAYTHTSLAIRDALEAAHLPTVEVHLTNIFAREEFRWKSLMTPVVTGQISGFGANSYALGLIALAGLLTGGARRS